MAADSLGARVRSLRESQNISQADLARMTGVEQTAISRIEVRDGYNPSASVVYKIAKALGTSSDALLDGLVKLNPVPLAPSANGMVERLGNEIASLHKGQAQLAQALDRLNGRLDAMERPKARR